MKALKFTLVEKDETSFYEKLLKIYCTIKGIKLSPMQASVMVQFCLSGVNQQTKNFLFDSEFLISDQHYRNIQSYLFKVGLLTKEGRNYKVVEALSFHERMAVIVGLDCDTYNEQVTSE